MYDVAPVLSALDAHMIEIVILCGLVAMVPTFTWFIAAIFIGNRERLCIMPPVCTLFWFAHDTSYLMRFNDWFSVYDHWYFKLFWVLLVFTVFLELIYIKQAMVYLREEWAPKMSPHLFQGIVVLAVVVSVALWSLLKANLNDPLYIVAFGFTVVIYPLSAIPMMLRRRSSAGQTNIIWLGYMGLAVGYFSATILFFGPAFRSWLWISLAVIAIGAGIAAWWLAVALRRGGKTSAGVRIPAVGGHALT